LSIALRLVTGTRHLSILRDLCARVEGASSS
jgi:hypothetical protein